MWKYIILFLILILFIFVLINIFHKSSVSTTQPYSTVVQTTKTIETIPYKVSANWKLFAPTFKRNVLNDDECIEFLTKFYGKRYVDKFNELKLGAHKADLFRYAWLYVYGGVYCDIKTILLKDLRHIFPDKNKCYMIYTVPFYMKENEFDPDSSRKESCYNGIIATPPKNPIMLDLLESCMETTNDSPYLINVNKMYNIVKQYCVSKSIEPGLNRTISDVPDIHFYVEKSFNIKHCDFSIDRYGLCMFVVDYASKEKIIKIRYHDYPWS